MKLIGFLCLLFIGTIVQAQKKDTLDVSDLYTPSSPGFVLMDKAPSAVDKPTTTKAFEADILNLAQGAAFQFTPFWFKNHPTLVTQDYFKPSLPLYQTLNFSVATIRTDSNYSISIGFRTQLVRIYSKRSRDSLSLTMGTLKNLLTSLGDDLRQHLIDSIAGDTAAVAKDIKLISKDTAAIEKVYREKFKGQMARPTFGVEVAGAGLGVTPNSPFSKGTLSSLNRSGLWMNIRYSPFSLPLDFVGVGRYTWIAQKPAKISSSDSAFFDIGLGVFYSNKMLSVSGEFLNRHDYSQQKNYDRIAFALNYKISSQIVVVAAFGKNFDNVENVFTALGVNFGLSKNSVQIAQPIQ